MIQHCVPIIVLAFAGRCSCRNDLKTAPLLRGVCCSVSFSRVTEVIFRPNFFLPLFLHSLHSTLRNRNNGSNTNRSQSLNRCHSPGQSRAPGQHRANRPLDKHLPQVPQSTSANRGIPPLCAAADMALHLPRSIPHERNRGSPTPPNNNLHHMPAPRRSHSPRPRRTRTLTR